VVRAPSVLIRAILFAVDAGLLAAYYSLSSSLWEASTWWDVAFIALVLIPAVFLLVWLLLPLWSTQPLPLFLAGVALVALAAILQLAGWDAASGFAKLGAVTALGWWFLGFFERAAWVVAVAAIIPFVDAYSVWKGPTHDIVAHQRHLFTTLSFAFPVPGEASAANLGLPDLLFFSLFLAAAARFGLRVFVTWLFLAASFGATIAIAVAWNKPGLPALPLLSVGFLLANADLLWRALRSRSA
jgi:hypothetical protein